MRRVMMCWMALAGLLLSAPPAHAGAPPNLWVMVGPTVINDGDTRSFASTTVGSGVDLAVDIGNLPGGGVLHVEAVTLFGSGGVAFDPDPVGVQPTWPADLTGGIVHTVYLRCHALEAGDFTGALLITSNDATHPTFTLHVQCHVDPPPIEPDLPTSGTSLARPLALAASLLLCGLGLRRAGRRPIKRV